MSKELSKETSYKLLEIRDCVEGIQLKNEALSYIIFEDFKSINIQHVIIDTMLESIIQDSINVSKELKKLGHRKEVTYETL